MSIPLNPEPAPILVRRAMPAVLTLMVCALVLVPSTYSQMARLSGSIALIYVFHLTLFRPEGVHWIAVVLVGLVIDFWSEPVIGLTPLLMLGFQQVVITLSDDLTELSFRWRWALFVILGSVFYVIYGWIVSAAFGIPGFNLDLVGRLGVATGLYPLMILGLHTLDQRLLYPSRKG
ncbi:MAG: hypothetical protein AAGA36_06000 [Pseudomonadota bacterium]